MLFKAIKLYETLAKHEHGDFSVTQYSVDVLKIVKELQIGFMGFKLEWESERKKRDFFILFSEILVRRFRKTAKNIHRIISESQSERIRHRWGQKQSVLWNCVYIKHWSRLFSPIRAHKSSKALGLFFPSAMGLFGIFMVSKTNIIFHSVIKKNCRERKNIWGERNENNKKRKESNLV